MTIDFSSPLQWIIGFACIPLLILGRRFMPVIRQKWVAWEIARLCERADKNGIGAEFRDRVEGIVLIPGDATRLFHKMRSR